MKVLFTGQSGQNINSELQKFKNDFKLFTHLSDKRPHYFKVENVIEEIYKKDKQITSNTKQTWKKFLREPYSLQESYWKKSFEKILTQIQDIEAKTPTANFFINLHAIHYHPRTQEYLSILNLDLLKKLRPDKIISLIDDIYDIRHRLALDPNDIFYDRIKNQNEAYKRLKIAMQLARVLDWRAKEIMMSRFIAKELDIKHFVLAIKHPWDTLFNLTFENKQSVYLSHPISEPRRLEIRGEYDEAKKIRNEITQISSKLCENFITFLPTTIDEFRIKKEKNSDGEIFYAVLNKRWENEIYAESKEMLYSVSGFDDTDALWQKHEPGFIDTEFNFILKSLNDTISDQVTSRDYMLVEQSDILVVYRPLYNGNASGGVKEENIYHEDIERTASILGRDTKNFKFVYCPKSDIELYKKNQFNLLLKKYIQAGIFTYRKEESFDSIEEYEYQALLKSDSDQDLLLDLLRLVNSKHGIQISNDQGESLDSPNPLKDIDSETTGIELKFVSEFLNILRVITFYKEIADLFEEDATFDANKFIEKIKGIVTKQK